MRPRLSKAQNPLFPRLIGIYSVVLWLKFYHFLIGFSALQLKIDPNNMLLFTFIDHMNKFRLFKKYIYDLQCKS